MNYLDFNKWRKFKVGEVLQRIPIKSVSKVLCEMNLGKTKVIGNSSLNNGVIDYVDISGEYMKYVHRGNVLSYGAKGGKFFYQKDQWVSTDHVHMFFNENLNEQNQLFICTILNKLLEIKGGWCSSLESNIVNEKILLPVDQTGNPDWDFMDKYIKSLKERERERVLNLLSHL